MSAYVYLFLGCWQKLVTSTKQWYYVKYFEIAAVTAKSLHWGDLCVRVCVSVCVCVGWGMLRGWGWGRGLGIAAMWHVTAKHCWLRPCTFLVIVWHMTCDTVSVCVCLLCVCVCVCVAPFGFKWVECSASNNHNFRWSLPKVSIPPLHPSLYPLLLPIYPLAPNVSSLRSGFVLD